VALLGAHRYLRSNDQVVVSNIGEQRMLTLKDGTRIYLNTDTRVVLQDGATQRHVTLEVGEALFDVAQDPRRPFVVTARGVEVAALGTSFVVRRDLQQLTILLLEGKVTVLPAKKGEADAAGPERFDSGMGLADGTVLMAGQRLALRGGEIPRLDTPAIETVTAWRRGEVIFDDTRLQDAVDEMNRYSVLQLEIDDAQVAEIRISGIFRTGDSTRFARAVGETYDLVVRQKSGHIRILRPDAVGGRV
jgi:transmembrane sensor